MLEGLSSTNSTRAALEHSPFDGVGMASRGSGRVRWGQAPIDRASRENSDATQSDAGLD